MGKTAIVTNAVCDMTPEEAAALQVTIIPECIVFDGVPAFSNLDFDPPELFRRLERAKELPTGAHPNVEMYRDAFRACEAADEILCINMTSRMSGSFNTANVARQLLEDEGFAPKIFVYDSLALSHGLGFLVREAAQLAAAGADAAAIQAHLDTCRDKIGIYFVMRSLENARKGGRIGAIKCVLADSLGVKPVLMFREGMVSDVCVTRGFDQGVSRLAGFYAKRARKGAPVTIFHGDNLPAAQGLKAQILEIDPVAQVSIRWLGSAIGIYTGAGCVGITFWE